MLYKQYLRHDKRNKTHHKRYDNHDKRNKTHNKRYEIPTNDTKSRQTIRNSNKRYEITTKDTHNKWIQQTIRKQNKRYEIHTKETREQQTIYHEFSTSIVRYTTRLEDWSILQKYWYCSYAIGAGSQYKYYFTCTRYRVAPKVTVDVRRRTYSNIIMSTLVIVPTEKYCAI